VLVSEDPSEESERSWAGLSTSNNQLMQFTLEARGCSPLHATTCTYRISTCEAAFSDRFFKPPL
jgi:hypothetical protein